MGKNLIKAIVLIVSIAPACVAISADTGAGDKKVNIGRWAQILSIASRVINAVTSIFSQIPATQINQQTQTTQTAQATQASQVAQNSQPQVTEQPGIAAQNTQAAQTAGQANLQPLPGQITQAPTSQNQNTLQTQAVSVAGRISNVVSGVGAIVSVISDVVQATQAGQSTFSGHHHGRVATATNTQINTGLKNFNLVGATGQF